MTIPISYKEGKYVRLQLKCITSSLGMVLTCVLKSAAASSNAK